jgi:ATP-dependent helicase/nuclease subunit A
LHIDRSEEQPRGYLPIYGPRRSQWGSPPLLAHPPGWEQLATEEQRFLDAEANRLLYVAATRAGVKLVVSQRDDAKANERNPWRLFDSYLPEAVQARDPGPVASRASVEVKIDPEDWQRDVGAIEQRWQAVTHPTYAVQAVKALVIREGPKPRGAEKGGAEWGTVLHSLLEAAMKRPGADLSSLAVSLLENEDLPLALADDAVATVNQVMASEIWGRARAAELCLTEVPLETLSQASDQPPGLPTVVRGVIDLVFCEPAGWTIVDYKTERVDAGEIPELVTYYRPQVAAYAELWEKVVRQPVAERGLFFTQHGTYCSM